ncbi:Serine/threonine-protein kinase ppk30 [Lasiodiplodia hormozganensis]|uniref:non-specific serine/threonine protein kinase n=1 Tax=Lasiodiplodia hormozganensis TaxID=869390 RepID=A0AA39Y7Y4_9PEZI|nr:Serine/threonine-protein kinase ppk30 [Lasiodiplodia hormozganensis]
MTSQYHPSTVTRPGVFHAPHHAVHHNAPPGTFAPGTKVQVGNHRVVIEKYLSEGGFAHVYVVKVPNKAGDRYDIAVLKRVAVPDKDALANMRTEVETMKKLKGHRKIVTYIDSHASQLKAGGYEVFLLMEFCAGGGLIDFMNTRLQHRLTEPEILHIFSDVAEGVACMHYLKPPLLHRDLKVENVLISTEGASRVYKLCDFGSTAPPRPAATNAAEGRLIEDDIQRHTTMQYRSPEMVDVYRRLPIDEKSDIWALGVLLYKLCYYTTPFEEQGQMAILNASYKFPHYPPFSDRLKTLIAWMLKEHPQQRPNIYQVVKEVCAMRNRDCPIKDIYTNRTQSETRKNQQLPSPEPNIGPTIGLSKAAPVQQVQVLPEITPMRRGRPTAPVQQSTAAHHSPSPMRTAGGVAPTSDPFAALDSTSAPVRAAAADELAQRFPSLDEFSILHDRGNKFQFSSDSPVEPKAEAVQKRVAEALADEAFTMPSHPQPRREQPTSAASSAIPSRSDSLRSAQTMSPNQRPEPRQTQASQIHQPQPQRPSMVSTGIQTSPPGSPALKPEPAKYEAPKYPDINQRPIWRVPQQSSHARALSQPRSSEDNPRSTPSLLKSEPNPPLPQRPGYLDMHRSKSQTATLQLPQSPASSRPSLEGSRPSGLDLTDPINRSKSANSRARPSSVHVESSLDFLRDREASRKGDRVANLIDTETDLNRVKSAPTTEPELEETNITSNVDFLRSMEGDDGSRRREHHRTSSNASKHSKRTSLPSLSNTKNILAGKFGDAFRRFENNTSQREPQRTPSPEFDRINAQLTPIAGSEVTGERSEDDTAIDETQDLPPEVRRELERRRLSQEEKRVAEAAAEYRKRIDEQGEGGKGKPGGGPSKASTIQDRVKNLLQDTQTSPKRTAEGYGRYTEREISEKGKPPPPVAKKLPSLPSGAPQSELTYRPARPQQPSTTGQAQSNSASNSPSLSQGNKPPPAPPKPKALRTGGQFESPNPNNFPPSPEHRKPPSRGGRPADGAPGLDNGLGINTEDWEANFSKRYPSLSGLEMVETEVPNGSRYRDI